MGIVVIGDVFIDIKGYSLAIYPAGKKCRNGDSDPRRRCEKCCENIANIELQPTFISAVDDNAMGRM